MRRPSRRRRQREWSASALAAVALLVFVGVGVWEYQHWQEQKSQDEQRTSRLIACLEAAQRAVDTTAATNACAAQYADRVPALLEDNPYAFAPVPTIASESSPLGAMTPPGSPAPRPTLSPSLPHASEAAVGPGPTRSGVGSDQPSAGRDPMSEQGVRPPGRHDEPFRPADPKTRGSSAPPPVTRGEDVSGEPPAAAEPARPAPPVARPSDEARPGGAAGSTPGR
jgi:hypothetical protein